MVKNPGMKGVKPVHHGRFVFFPPYNVMWDKKVGGYGTVKFAKEMLKRRARNKVARASRKANR